MERNDQNPQQQDKSTATPMTGTNSQPGAAQRNGVPDAPENVRPEQDRQQTGGQACADGGCI